MNTIESIQKAVAIFDKHQVSVALLHTTNLYPTPIHLVRFGAMMEMHQAFPDKVFGLSDHTLNNNACLGAVALSLSDTRNYDFVLYAGEIRIFDIAAALYICNDFFIHKTDKFLLICKNKEKFELIKEFIKEK